MKPLLTGFRVGALALLLAACQPLPQALPMAPAASTKTTSVTVSFDWGRNVLAYKRYTRADIDHVKLNVYRVDNGAEVLAGSLTLQPSQLGDKFTLDALTQNTFYYLRADAYNASGDRISVPNASALGFTTDVITTQSIVKLPLMLAAYTPNFGHAEASFIAGLGGVKAIVVDAYHVYYLDENGDVNRFPHYDPSDIMTLQGPFDTIAKGPGGLVYGANTGGGISQLLFDDEVVYPLDTTLQASSLVLAPSGAFYAATRAADGGSLYQLAFDADLVSSGEFVAPVETPVATGCYTAPGHLAVSSAGDLYAVEAGAPTVVKVTPGGVVSSLPGVSGQSGLVIGADGELIVASVDTDALIRITTAGVHTPFVGVAGTPGFAAGQGAAATLDNPGPMALAPNGTLYLIDVGNDVLRRIF